jgi:hypothetical protein
MKKLTIDELLTRMFRDTANRIGWNVYKKDKNFISTANLVHTRQRSTPDSFTETWKI